MTAVLLLQITAAASLEVWPTVDRDFQHRAWGQISAQVATPVRHVVAEGYLELMWWGSHTSKAPGSFLNLEASKVLERRHGGGLRWKSLGIFAERRGIEWLGQTPVWGQTMGYSDGVGPWLKTPWLEVRLPLVTLNVPTLPREPWHLLGHLPVGSFSLDVEAVPSALDASVRWKGLALRYGTLAYPGFGSPIHRLALEVEAR